MAKEKNEIQKLCSYLHRVTDKVEKQRISLGHLYRCKKTDPLETVKAGRLYRLRKWHNTFIVCGEGFAISERVMPEYFERVMEEEDKKWHK